MYSLNTEKQGSKCNKNIAQSMYWVNSAEWLKDRLCSGKKKGNLYRENNQKEGYI